MTEISTPSKNSLCTENLLNTSEGEGLSEDDQLFYSSLKDGMDKLSKVPRNSTIEKVLDYSKSL